MTEEVTKTANCLFCKETIDTHKDDTHPICDDCVTRENLVKVIKQLEEAFSIATRATVQLVLKELRL